MIALLTTTAAADTVVAARTIRANEVILTSDVKLIDERIAGMTASVGEVVGLEARRILYSGRPIALADVGPAAVIDRNQIISLGYKISGLIIRTEGRALARGGVGDRIRVINLDSRSTVSGRIDHAGIVWVGE